MPISRADAARALADIGQTEQRGRAARTYHAGGATLILWGAIWFVCYAATGLLPAEHWWMAWLPGNLAGFLATAWLYRRGAPARARVWPVILAAVCFLVALYAVCPPRSANAAAALPALLVGFLYVVLGAVWLIRYAAIGAFLFVATLVGLFLLPHGFDYWMAVMGGGALVLGGVWLRSA